MEKYYSLVEVSRILGVKLNTIRDWQRKGFILAYKYEGKKKWYVSQSEIERLQQSMRSE